MASRQIDLVLRKQQLLMRADVQRVDMSRRLAGIDGALDRVDSVREHLAWAKEKIPRLSVALLVVLAAKPKLTLRLAKRTWLGWLLLRQARGGRVPALLTTAGPLLRGLIALIRRRLEPSAAAGSARRRPRRTG